MRSVTADSVTEFGADVRAGLSKGGQKELPSKYFYDDVGSALFEVISVLPEYGLTRADERLLQRYARQIVANLPQPLVVAELGSGTGRKTRWILEALSRLQPVSYYPIEISPTALAVCKRELGDLDSVSITGFEREYLDGLFEVASRRQNGERLIVLFLGSSIGNFEYAEAVNLLKEIRRTLDAGDALLLGTDLEKPVSQLLAAYDDALGVTAAFNLNLLSRINRELAGDFNLQRFEHRVKFNHATCSIEMHLRSTCNQTAAVGKAGFSVTLSEGETILTENSHKYSLGEISKMAEDAGFYCQEQYIDQEWPFAETLFIAG